MLSRVTVALTAAAIFAAGADRLKPIAPDAPADVVGGPVVVNVSPHSATVVWVVKTAQKLSRAADRDSLRAMARVGREDFKDLKPGKTYEYEFRGAEPVRGQFKTPPEKRANFLFIVYGDTRTRNAVHQQVVDAMLKHRPDFVVHTGDLVADGTQTDLWREFLSIEKHLLSRTVLFPSPGNHERQSAQYFDFLDAPSHYSFRWGSVHVSVLNSDVGNVPREQRRAFWDDQKQWLEQDLAAAAGADFRFVAFHHPPFTAVSNRNGSEYTLELLPMLEKHKVAAVFSGHDHNYQRHLKNGIQYIVTGGGGAPLYDVNKPIPGLTQKVATTENYVTMDVKGERILMRALDLNGTALDEVQFRAR